MFFESFLWIAAFEAVSAGGGLRQHVDSRHSSQVRNEDVAHRRRDRRIAGLRAVVGERQDRHDGDPVVGLRRPGGPPPQAERHRPTRDDQQDNQPRAPPGPAAGRHVRCRDRPGDAGRKVPRDAPQIVAEIVRGWIPFVAVAGDRTRDDQADLRGHRRVHLVRQRRRLRHRRDGELERIDTCRTDGGR